MDSDDILSSQCEMAIWEPQKTWSAITYYKRYNLWCIFNIITDDDNDWNGKQGKQSDKKVFDDKKMKAMYTRAVGKNKWEVMQEVLKIQKTYTMSDEVKADMDLFLGTIK